jgi:hypothetical protein
MNDFPVDKNSYLAFDGLSIRDKIRERLNQTGIFTDQNFEGSNLAGFNDALAMSFSLLIYYLNQSSSNGQLTQTAVYENASKIVKDFGYNPIGHQTASIGFTLTAQDLSKGLYTIPRYSSLDVAGVIYSTNNDISFTKTIDTSQEIQGIEMDSVLYQGTFLEFPSVTPSGNVNETILLTVDDNNIVDAFNIDVYVKTNNVWKKWKKTQSLFLNNYSDEVFEVRFNENKRYEIKFGDDINGKKLTSSDQVAIYYLKSLGVAGEVGANVLNDKKLVSLDTDRLSEILTDINDNVYMDDNALRNLILDNKFTSTYYNAPETIDNIRKNAPSSFRSQFNLTTNKSFETFVRSNLSHIIHDVKVKNNSEYIDSYIKYFYDIGLSKPQNESRALFNQVTFADSCNFNNIYIFVVPKTINNTLSYLTPAQKTLMIDSMKEEKVLTSEIIPMDPVYISFDLCISESNTITTEDIKNTELYIVRSLTKRSESSIKRDIENILVSAFSSQNNNLGQNINIYQLDTMIRDIEGVGQIYTRNKKTDVKLDGLKFISWNPVYFDATKSEVGSTAILEDFQFPFLNNKTFIDRITIV